MNTLRALAAEARWRGLWGTVRAIKMHRLGSKPYFVAEDEAGNRFFSNPALPAGRDRWVEYAEAKNFDAVKIAPEWHAWLVRSVELPPTERTDMKRPVYQGKITPNLSGTSEAYVPTHHVNNPAFKGQAGEKVSAWDPSTAATSPGRGVRPRTPADTAADTKDILDLK
ncbi:hypothetical protein MMPV_006195 [Pyropia vietnamensis]